MTSMNIQKNASSLIATIYAQIILQSWSGILVAQDKFTWTLPSYEISVPPFTSAKVFGVTWKEVVELPYHPTQSNQYSFCIQINLLHQISGNYIPPYNIHSACGSNGSVSLVTS
jgi:hypothetical protein